MPKFPDAVWLSTSLALRKLDQQLLHYLSLHKAIARWDYAQTADEPISLEVALVLLHDYLKTCDRPLHLIGHSTSGLLGLLYARRYPERVQSLTLLSVGVNPSVDWQAHYYVQRQLLPCDRRSILSQMVYTLFGRQSRQMTAALVNVLEQDLQTSLSPHTLFKRINLPSGGVTVPLMVCAGDQDVIVDPNQLQGWQEWLKTGDRLWQCPNGCYFFHYYYPEVVGKQLLNFWSTVRPQMSEMSSRSMLL
jgi:pimeloyl-ACP methyl ester carboxylesterase